MQGLPSELVIAASCYILPSSYCHVSMHMMQDKLFSYYRENTVKEYLKLLFHSTIQSSSILTAHHSISFTVHLIFLR
jgi:hypothetical protein